MRVRLRPRRLAPIGPVAIPVGLAALAVRSWFDHEVGAGIQQLLQAVVIPSDATGPGATVRELEDKGRAVAEIDLALVTVMHDDDVPGGELRRLGRRGVHGRPSVRRDHE